MKIEDLYKYIVDHIIKTWETCKECDDNYRPKTFAVVSHENDFSSENLGKTHLDYDKPYFYSDGWNGKSKLLVEYPAIIVYADNTIVDNIFTNKPAEITKSIQLCFVMSNNKALRGKDSDVLLENEVIQHTEKALLQILHLISKASDRTSEGGGVEPVNLTDPANVRLNLKNSLNRINEKLYINELWILGGEYIGSSVWLKVSTDNCITPGC